MPWVWLKGSQRTASRVTSATNVVKLSNAFASGNQRAGFEDILFSGTTNVYFDLQTMGGSGSTVIEFQSTFINNDLVFKGRSTADFIECWNSQILGNINLYALSFNFMDSLLTQGTKTISISDVGSTASGNPLNGIIASFASNQIGGAGITFNKTKDMVWNIQFTSSNSSSWTFNAIGGSWGNLTVFSDVLLPNTIIKNTANVVIFAPNPPSKSGIVRLAGNGGTLILDSSVKNDTSIAINAKSIQTGFLYHTIFAGFGFYINSTTGGSDANLLVSYISQNTIN